MDLIMITIKALAEEFEKQFTCVGGIPKNT